MGSSDSKEERADREEKEDKWSYSYEVGFRQGLEEDGSHAAYDAFEVATTAFEKDGRDKWCKGYKDGAKIRHNN